MGRTRHCANHILVAPPLDLVSVDRREVTR